MYLYIVHFLAYGWNNRMRKPVFWVVRGLKTCQIKGILTLMQKCKSDELHSWLSICELFVSPQNIKAEAFNCCMISPLMLSNWCVTCQPTWLHVSSTYNEKTTCHVKSCWHSPHCSDYWGSWCLSSSPPCPQPDLSLPAACTGSYGSPATGIDKKVRTGKQFN